MPRDDPVTEEERRAGDAYDLIRMRLARLEKNIDKPAPIPARRDDIKAPKPPPDFVRNVVGSSAAAGSAEFHIYRNNRKKEQNRLDYIAMMAEREELDAEYRAKREEIESAEASKTAKKRAKRQRKKDKAKRARKNKVEQKGSNSSESETDSDEEDEAKNENIADSSENDNVNKIAEENNEDVERNPRKEEETAKCDTK